MQLEDMLKVGEVEGTQKVGEDKQLMEEDTWMMDMQGMQDMVQLHMSQLVVDKKTQLLAEEQCIKGLEGEELHRVVRMEHMLWLGSETIQITIQFHLFE